MLICAPLRTKIDGERICFQSCLLFIFSFRVRALIRNAPPEPCPTASQECVRFHTINRATGRARIWEVGLTFSSQLTANAYDTEGAIN